MQYPNVRKCSTVVVKPCWQRPFERLEKAIRLKRVIDHTSAIRSGEELKALQGKCFQTHDLANKENFDDWVTVFGFETRLSLQATLRVLYTFNKRSKPAELSMITSRLPDEFQPKTVKGAAAFSKGISILQLVAEAEERPCMADLVKMSGLPRPTLHRLLKALEAERLVECTADKKYIVGSRLIQFAGRALEHSDVSRMADPELTRLRDHTNETILLAIRDGHEMVYIQKRESPQAIRLATSIGCRASLHASSIGKVVLAFLKEGHREAIIDNLELTSKTRFTTTCRDQLRQQLGQIRKHGYSVTHQESQLELQCYGCAILDRSGLPVAGMAVSVPTYRLKDDAFYIQPLLETCRRISRRLNA